MDQNMQFKNNIDALFTHFENVRQTMLDNKDEINNRLTDEMVRSKETTSTIL